MPLYYITGGSGTGKSTTLEELKRRGFEAYDVDFAGPVTAKWLNNKTGYIHPKSSIKAADRTPEFLNDHSWKVPRHEVEELASLAKDKTVFLGGNIANGSEVFDLCTYVFALVVDNTTLEHRLTSRTNNDWGKSHHELKLALDWNTRAAASHKKKGHIIIDARQPLEKVVDEIVAYVHDNK